MSTVICHPDLAKDWLKAQVNVSGLTALTVTVNGTARSVQGVYNLVAPQETPNPYPCVIIESPVLVYMPQQLHCNGRYISQASFDIDMRFVARDVEPDDSGLRSLRAKAIELCEGQNGTVTGGRINSCIVRTFLPDQRLDKGTYIYTEISVTFRVAAQVD